ncbi:hypothetical protein [Serratia fonticola]|uniref:hypothetical protein n=1 Tax=Serratia fonticola TaxID=47917 RepID=UPI0008FF04BC|nr:hypothetical protein [Serratia fonticola]
MNHHIITDKIKVYGAIDKENTIISDSHPRGDFVVGARSSLEIFRTDTPIIPETRRPLELYNNGRADEVTAKFYWSHSFTNKWFEEGSITVKKYERGVLNTPSSSFYYSKYVIHNNTDTIAYISAYII